MFYLFAAATVISALGVVLSGSVVRMAMWLFSCFGAVAMLFFLLAFNAQYTSFVLVPIIAIDWL